LRHYWRVSGVDQPRAIACDSDARPERMRPAREILHRHGAAGDLHASMAARLVAEGLLPVLDVGCGEGELQRHLSYGAWVGVDASRRWRRERQEALSWLKPTLCPPRPGRSAPPHCCTSDITSAIPPVHWPRPGEWCGGRPCRGRGRGTEPASPELAFALPDGALTFDADIGPGLMADHFGLVESRGVGRAAAQLCLTAAVRQRRREPDREG